MGELVFVDVSGERHEKRSRFRVDEYLALMDESAWLIVFRSASVLLGSSRTSYQPLLEREMILPLCCAIPLRFAGDPRSILFPDILPSPHIHLRDASRLLHPGSQRALHQQPRCFRTSCLYSHLYRQYNSGAINASTEFPRRDGPGCRRPAQAPVPIIWL